MTVHLRGRSCCTVPFDSARVATPRLLSAPLHLLAAPLLLLAPAAALVLRDLLAQLAALVLSVATFAPFAVSSRRAQGVLSTSATVVDPAKDTLAAAAAQHARALSYLLR